MPKWKFLLSILIFLLGVSGIYAQKPDISFKHISVEQGLPHHIVNDFLEDRKGFIWTCSAGGGLSRFDGHQFKQFRHNPADTNSLSSDIVSNFKEDQDGMIWIVAGRHLNRLNPVTEEVSRINLGEFNRRLNNLYIDEDNNLWLAIGSRVFLYFPSKMSMKEIPLSESHAISPNNGVAGAFLQKVTLRISFSIYV